MAKYYLGVLRDNLTYGYYTLKTLRIEEKPLLDFRDAIYLAFLAIFILTLGAIVQVRTIYFISSAMCIS